MSCFGLILGLCFASQSLSSPLHTLFLPYMQPQYGYPWMGHGVPVIQRNPWMGHGVPVIQRNDEPPMVSPVVIELDPEFQCTENGTFADPLTCDHFYVCHGDIEALTSFRFDCPPGLYFDTTQGLCDDKVKVGEGCKHQSAVESCASLAGDARTLCLELEKLKVEPIVINVVSECEDVCDDAKAPGIYADIFSCTKFCNCAEIDGSPDTLKAFQISCPPTLVFNSATKVCDHAANVVCSRAIETIETADPCSSLELNEEQQTLCQNNTWKQFDHFRK